MADLQNLLLLDLWIRNYSGGNSETL